MTDRVDVPVAGGTLATFRLGSPPLDAPLALAIHGITSSSRSWLATARALGDRAALAAVDLRGRGASHQLPPPFGLAAHVRDMVAVLDRIELDQALVVGHSLGAYVAVRLAVEYPDRVRGLVLVDGGLKIPGTESADPERFLEAFLGPTLARLRMTFPDLAAYRAWWAEHPALAGADIDPDDLTAYADHDLIGRPPELRSAVNPEVVRVDGVDLFQTTDAHALAGPATLMCAPRGMVDDANPMQPLALVQEWAASDPNRRQARQITDVNHYTIVLGRHGAAAVAAEIDALLTASAAPAAAPPAPRR